MIGRLTDPDKGVFRMDQSNYFPWLNTKELRNMTSWLLGRHGHIHGSRVDEIHSTDTLNNRNVPRIYKAIVEEYYS